MSKRSKGKCKYCGKEYTRAAMVKHLADCEKQKTAEAEISGKQCGYFQLVVEGAYDKAYWLIIEVWEGAKLKDVDSFLRAIWLECCGHLSAFEIRGTRYEVYTSDENEWLTPSRDMNYKLKSILQKGMKFSYEYDFGSSTDLIITVQDYRMARRKKDKVIILSRNNPPELICDTCLERPAVVICAECAYQGKGLLCEACRKTHECGEEVQLNVCNSPRMGVCGYEGSSVYPDRFVPDEEG